MRLRHPDVSLFCLILLLTVFGLVMVFSASAPRAIIEQQDAFYFLKRHAVYAVIGVAAMLTTWSLDYHRWLRWLPLIIAGALFGDLLLYVPALQVEALGAVRWVSFGGVISFQPSELLKFAAVLLLAAHFAATPPPAQRLAHFIRGGVFAAIPVALILLQSDLGSAAIVAATFLLAVLFSGLPLGYFIAPVAACFAALPPLILLEPYRVKRLFAFVNPWADPLGAGFQTIQSLFSFASGGLLGLGVGASRQKHFYLPQAHTDFIFAVIGEELGMLGAVTLVCLFVLLALLGFWVAFRAKDRLGMLLGTLITGTITVQAFINMAVNVGLMPVKGFTLPLISYGGTSLIITMAMLGILLNIAAQLPDEAAADEVVPSEPQN